MGKVAARRLTAASLVMLATVSGGLVSGMQPAAAAACTPYLSDPWISADGKLGTGGHVWGSCPAGNYQIGLYKKVAGTWDLKKISNTFNLGGGSSIAVNCSTGTWSSAILKSGESYLGGRSVKISRC
jgi:hypothetical protein